MLPLQVSFTPVLFLAKDKAEVKAVSVSPLFTAQAEEKLLNQVPLLSRYCLALQVLSALTAYYLVHQDKLPSKTDMIFLKEEINVS